MARSLGQIVNSGLKTIKEPEVTEFTSTNILQQELIEEANNRVSLLRNRLQFDWTLTRTSFVTTATVTDGYAACTNGSATVTSVDSAGADATDFGSVAVGMYFRRPSDTTSYLITAVDIFSTPNTLTLEQVYTGTTTTAAKYVALTDTYAITDTDFDELVNAGYGDGFAFGVGSKSNLHYVDFGTMFDASGGNMHTDSSGKPRLISHIEPDSSLQTQFRLWPYPDSLYLVELYYSKKFSANTTFATNMFGGDAPDIAYQFVEHGVRARACLFDKQEDEALVWEQRAREALKETERREAREDKEDGYFRVETYRTYGGSGIETRSQLAFDHRSSR